MTISTLATVKHKVLRIYATAAIFLLPSLNAISSDSNVSPSLTVESFLAPPTLIDAALSPSGKLAATVWNHGYRREVRVFDLDNQKLLSAFGDHIVRPYEVNWADEDTLLVKKLIPKKPDELRETWEKEGPFLFNTYEKRLFSTNVMGDKEVTLLNDDRIALKAFDLAHVTHYLKNDPDHILMSLFRRDFLTQYKVNVRSGHSEIVAKGSRFTLGFINDRDGKLKFRYDFKPVAKTVEVYRYVDRDDWQLQHTFYFDQESEAQNDIELKDLVGIYQNKLVYRKRNEKTGYFELLASNGTASDSAPLVSLPTNDVVSVIKSPWDREIIGYTTLIDQKRSHYFNPDSQAHYDRVAKHFPDENFYFSSFSENANKALVVSYGMRNPGSYHLFDKDTSRIVLFSYPFPSLPVDKLAHGVTAEYLTRDKVKIRAYVLFPHDYDGKGVLPAIVLPHGGPQSRDYAAYDDFAQFLATRGYIVIQPNFRGSTGYGKAFEEAGYKQWGGVMQDDVEDAAKFLIDEKLADPSRICIVGFSYGGYSALMATVKTPDLFTCSVSINGVSHLEDQIDFDIQKFTSDKTRQYIYNSIGDPEKDAEMLKANSPALHATTINTPILLIAGKLDNVVPFEQSEEMHRVLQENAKPVSFLVLEKTGHNPFNNKKNERLVYQTVEEFLARFLSGSASPNLETTEASSK